MLIEVGFWLIEVGFWLIDIGFWLIEVSFWSFDVLLNFCLVILYGVLFFLINLN